MLHEVLLILGFKVRANRLRNHGLHALRLNLGPSNQFEALVCVHVRRLTFERSRLVGLQANLLRSADCLKHLLVLFQFLLLLLRKVLRIARLALERQRVVGILRTLLMEDVLLSILPVRERLLVG